jgi:formylglycine-generating enzyme required for sulfatase activity
MSGKYALIIGNTEYMDSGLAQLTAPGKDAEDFARVLKDREIGAFDEVVTLVNENAANLSEAIEGFFLDKKPDDLLVFYFSGHGVRDEAGSLFLAVKNTNRKRLRATAIKTDLVREMMDQSRSKRQVIILDCCNSGAFASGTKAETGGTMGMVSSLQGYGRYILTASDATQFAWEGDQVIGKTENSLFTHFLVKGLKGEADSNSDGMITVDELYDYAFEQVREATPNQTPTKSSSKQEGDIILRQNIRIADIRPVSLPDQLIGEIENPYPEIRLRAVEQLAKILNGKKLGLARSAREALEKMSTEDDSRRVAQAAVQALGFFHQVEQKAEEEQKAKEEAGRLVREKAEAEQKAKETEILARTQAKREAAKSIQVFLSKLKIPALVLMLIVIGYFLLQGISSWIPPFSKSSLVTGSTKTSNIDGMTLVYVPAGAFTMGDDSGEKDERPAHKVYLDAFWIDQTEVTNKQYQTCVNAGSCKLPSDTSNFNNLNYEQHPVVYVDWNMAKAYCNWAGRILPTEAQWEKAARGTDGRIYPWGEVIDCNKANYQSSCVGNTASVGSYKSGKSPYGAYDMAGNVWEWVNDFYEENYYQDSPSSNPGGPISGAYRILRGGSWDNLIRHAHSSLRLKFPPDGNSYIVGFRCASSP